MADRGIGGTGDATRLADRGIGGTGSALRLADRGIGGTGIIAVITGFASICLGGQEVALPPDTPVELESQPATSTALRAGQVAVVEATGNAADLTAKRIAIRYEVIGPVTAAQGDTLRVAGQDVHLAPVSWGIHPAVGDFVAVSGLRRVDDTIEATRIERRAPGPILLHGRLEPVPGGLRIGTLPVRRDPATLALVGQEVTITGYLGPDGLLRPLSLSPDLVSVDPASYFGPAIGVLYVESFAVLDAGRLRLAPGFTVPAPGLRLQGPQHGVFRFDRSGGTIRATSVATAPTGYTAAPTPRFDPAPMPNRQFDRPGRSQPSSRGPGPNGSNGHARGNALAPGSNFPGSNSPSFGNPPFGNPNDGPTPSPTGPHGR